MPYRVFTGADQYYLDIGKLKIGDAPSFHHLYRLFYVELVLKAVSMLHEKKKLDMAVIIWGFNGL